MLQSGKTDEISHISGRWTVKTEINVFVFGK